MLKHTSLTISCLVAILLVGCQAGEEPVSASVVAAPKPSAKTDEKPQPKVDEAQASREALRQAMVDYVAPFPSRKDMFVPPRIKKNSPGSRVAEGDVQLKGLVNIDEPKAILDIEGATTLLAVGGEKYGVKVVSIDDHQVTLQRGPTRWIASLD